MENDWKFNGVMDCDKCKFNHQCNIEPDCPYFTGWNDGQKKLLNFEIANTDTVQLKNIFKSMLKELKAN
jgi:hypothetical protein